MYFFLYAKMSVFIIKLKKVVTSCLYTLENGLTSHLLEGKPPSIIGYMTSGVSQLSQGLQCENIHPHIPKIACHPPLLFGNVLASIFWMQLINP